MLEAPEPGLAQSLTKMSAAGVGPTAQMIFAHYWQQLAAGATGLTAEADIEPVADPPRLVAAPVSAADREAFARTALLRLNGGLGTSMGLNRAKALLPVRDGLTFLDLIVRQTLAARDQYQVRLPLLFLHSFSTQADSLQALAAYPQLGLPGLPLDLVQSQEPKLRRDDLTPVDWPANPALEWCPPGHGDIYPSLFDSGLLDQLIEAGFDYLSVSNSDNLGCGPSPQLAGWFARSGAPYAAEITRRTAMDLKGGQIVRRRRDGRLMLRELAQTPAADQASFTDAERHPYTNTNNLWLNLPALRAVLRQRQGELGLPLIRNLKTVDPTDPASPPVIQIESAMGAAIEVFDGAQVIAVSRDRFLPVKTTSELTLLRSDLYDWSDGWIPRPLVRPAPLIELGPSYQLINDYDRRLPFGLKLRQAKQLTVRGDWQFGDGVRVVGRVTLDEAGGQLPDGCLLTE
ncbi:MAG: UTP--glucose-1-phosphate uridylyltransferase [Propionibacteriaceae bacterium]|jgi:UTP--glucose-1-phosphate uridylyltransferase|nr:UTP--glucose-1-phosphate uridylyltransferase [Propionibacteriaceae bacterium]